MRFFKGVTKFVKLPTIIALFANLPTMHIKSFLRVAIPVLIVFSFSEISCRTSRKVTLSAPQQQPSNRLLNRAAAIFLKNEELTHAHVGICIRDLKIGKNVYEYQAAHYFTPASNTKLFSCYAAMKYLGDSIPSLKVVPLGPDDLLLYAMGDPTLMHTDFKNQPVYHYLKSCGKHLWFSDLFWEEKPYGTGWAWDDYNDDYLSERSALPIYGNLATFSGSGDHLKIVPSYFNNPEFIHGDEASSATIKDVHRDFHSNSFKMIGGSEYANNEVQVPFITSFPLAIKLLSDTLHESLNLWAPQTIRPGLNPDPSNSFILYSQPTDSMLSLMMHRSDNFYAEQSLLMVSNKLLGVMNDAHVIEALLNTDYHDLPQKPRWVDGSGLSRYNLFTPEDFVTLLCKMKNDFSWERITHILPSGDKGTLKGLYKGHELNIYAKTGSLSSTIALSGFLVTKSNKKLAFSILINQHMAQSNEIRKDIEKFLETIIDQY